MIAKMIAKRVTITLTMFVLTLLTGLSNAHALYIGNNVMWSTKLNMVNVLELLNNGAEKITYTVTAYAKDGSTIGVKEYTVDALSQRGIILNDGLLKNQTNKTGVLTVHRGSLDKSGDVSRDGVYITGGQLVNYRFNAAGTDVEFAYSAPISVYENLNHGATYVMYNSNQQQLNPEDYGNTVEQTLSIVNLSADERTFNIKTYNRKGQYIETSSVTLAPHARADIAAGDSRSNERITKIGMHKIIPQGESSTYYLAQLFRYSKRTATPTQYGFGQVTLASTGAYREFVPVSRVAGALNYVEVGNTTDTDLEARIYFYRKDGTKTTGRFNLPANSVKHFDVTDRIPVGQSGYVQVDTDYEDKTKDSSTGGVHIISSSYFHDATGALLGSSVIGGSLAYGNESYTSSFNLKRNSTNTLRLSNKNDTAETVTIKQYQGSNVYTKTLRIGAHKTVGFSLKDGHTFKPDANSAGVLTLEGNVFGYVQRHGGAAQGDIDFALSTPINIYMGLF